MKYFLIAILSSLLNGSVHSQSSETRFVEDNFDPETVEVLGWSSAESRLYIANYQADWPPRVLFHQFPDSILTIPFWLQASISTSSRDSVDLDLTTQEEFQDFKSALSAPVEVSLDEVQLSSSYRVVGTPTESWTPMHERRPYTYIVTVSAELDDLSSKWMIPTNCTPRVGLVAAGRLPQPQLAYVIVNHSDLPGDSCNAKQVVIVLRGS